MKPKDEEFKLEVGLSFEDAQKSFKKTFLVKTLESTGWNQARAADILKIQRSYLSRLIKEHDIKNI